MLSFSSGPPAKGETPCDSDEMDTVKTGSHIIQTVKENGVEKGSGILEPSLPNHCSINRDSVTVSPTQNMICISPIEDSYFVNNITAIKNGSLSSARTISKDVESSDSIGTSEASNTSSSRSDSSMNILDEGPVEPLYFEQYFQEEYCKASTLDECRELTGVADVDSGSSPCDREKSEEDEDNDDMLGGVFAFSEEGRNPEQYNCSSILSSIWSYATKVLNDSMLLICPLFFCQHMRTFSFVHLYHIDNNMINAPEQKLKMKI